MVVRTVTGVHYNNCWLLLYFQSKSQYTSQHVMTRALYCFAAPIHVLFICLQIIGKSFTGEMINEQKQKPSIYHISPQIRHTLSLPQIALHQVVQYSPIAEAIVSAFVIAEKLYDIWSFFVLFALNRWLVNWAAGRVAISKVKWVRQMLPLNFLYFSLERYNF